MKEVEVECRSWYYDLIQTEQNRCGGSQSIRSNAKRREEKRREWEDFEFRLNRVLMQSSHNALRKRRETLQFVNQEAPEGRSHNILHSESQQKFTEGHNDGGQFSSSSLVHQQRCAEKKNERNLESLTTPELSHNRKLKITAPL